MINYIEKGSSLHEAVKSAGYSISHKDNIVVICRLDQESITMDDESVVQSIIDNHDSIPSAQSDAKELVKEASATKRLQYVTQAAGKDAEYTFKAQEATQYNLDSSVGVFMQARINATGETAATVATEWNAKSVAWQAIGASIAAIEDKSSQDIDAETAWEECDVIAKAALVNIEAI